MWKQVVKAFFSCLPAYLVKSRCRRRSSCSGDRAGLSLYSVAPVALGIYVLLLSVKITGRHTEVGKEQLTELLGLHFTLTRT